MVKTLTSRWFKMPDAVFTNSEICRYREGLSKDDTVNMVVSAGRRSFKTELAKRNIVKYALTNPNVTVVIGAPTFPQVKKIFWKDIKDLIPKTLLVRKPLEVTLEIDLVNGSRIMLIGVIEQASRIEGVMVHRVFIDEAQLIPNLEEVFSSTFEPGLNATNGKIILIGRPRGKGFYYSCIKKGLDKRNDDWATYHWASSVILTPQQIERAKASSSKQYFEREYEAKFENSMSMAYHAYSDANLELPKEIQEQPIDPMLPIVLSFDFNFSVCPMTTLIGQFREIQINSAKVEVLYIHEVLSNVFTNTEKQITHIHSAIDKYHPTFGWRDYRYAIHGDYTGNYHHSVSHHSDYDLIQLGFDGCREYSEYLTPCKSIRNATAAVNNRLQTADGRVYVYFNKALCQPLIEDFDNLSWDDKSTDFAKIGDQYDHAAKALNYLVEYHYPLVEEETFIG